MPDRRAAALRDVTAARRSLDRARAGFEEAIRAAKAHASMSEIGRAAGLSRSRIDQIIRGV